MFASWHSYLDPASGAALATRDLFEDLTGNGWDCKVVCGPVSDDAAARPISEILASHRLAYYRERCAPSACAPYELYHFTCGGVTVCHFNPTSPSIQSGTPNEGAGYLGVLARALAKYRPRVVLTYGGAPAGPALIRAAKRAGAKVVFCLHNFAYQPGELFNDVDVLWVPSEFARRRYFEFGISAEAVLWPWDRRGARAPEVRGEFVTFVNPEPVKGVAWFARIASELGRRRPDIRFLVVEGRGGASWLKRLGPAVGGLPEITVMRNTSRPADFYARSRAVLMPSLWEESFGRVAAEACDNGIPVVASTRGALPETLGDAGILFDVPKSYHTQLLDIPSPEEVAPWARAVERLWDDDAYRTEVSSRCRRRAEVWDPDRLRPAVETFFRRIASP
jgi:glycosyltransferase involved in cell wall biosynthesis